MDETTRDAMRLRDRLAAMAAEFRMHRHGTAELNELEATACDDAAAMLRKLDTEVFRLRESIGLFKYGRMSRADLIRIPDTWNDDGRG